ncbi:PTS system maltose- and glucose-specific EIICB component [compost metagenome]
MVYYFLFRTLIIRLNLKTPGREDDIKETAEDATVDNNVVIEHAHRKSDDSRASKILTQIGGSDNIDSIDACITRLRLIVKDEKAVNDVNLKKLGASGVIRLGKGAVQVVFGPQSEAIKDEIKKLL